MSNTFIKTATDDVPLTFVGGGAGSTNIFEIDPVNSTTLVDQGGTNTLNLTTAGVVVTAAGSKTGSATIGVTVDATLNNGQLQFINQSQSGISFLGDPNFSSDSGTLALQGTFQNFILGSGDNLTTAPASFTASGAPIGGTSVTLMGSNNTVYAAFGTTVAGSTTNNNIIQNFSQAQVDAFLAAANLFSDSPALVNLFSDPSNAGTLFGSVTTGLGAAFGNPTTTLGSAFGNVTTTLGSAFGADSPLAEILGASTPLSSAVRQLDGAAARQRWG